MKLLIWGTGNTAREILGRGINGELAGFIRSKAYTEGERVSLHGIPVYTPETIDIDYDLIFVASIYSDEIYRTIRKYNISLEKVCFWKLPDEGIINVKENLEKAVRFLSPENLLFIPGEKRGSSITDDGRYPEFCLKASKEDTLFSHFRSHPIYRVVLEHTSYQFGKQYFDIICENRQTCFTEQDWANFARNDLYGGAELHSFDLDGRPFMISPSTLRYVKVLQDILTLFNEDEIKTVAEIGVGYGGAVQTFGKPLEKPEKLFAN